MHLVVLGVEAGEEVPGGEGGGRYKTLFGRPLSPSLPGRGRQIPDSRGVMGKTPRNRSRVARSVQLKKPLLTRSPCSTPSPWAKLTGRKKAPTKER